MAKRRSSGEGTIFFSEKENLWVGEVSLPDGKRKRKRSKTQKVVKDWLLAQRDSVRDGTVIENDKVTVAQFIDRYLADVAAHTLRPKTIESYNSLIRIHIKPEIGDIRLTSLRPEHLQSMYSKKLNAGLSHRTVQFIHSIIHKVLVHALKWGLVIRNVADLVDAPSVKRKAPVTFSPGQVKIFLESVKGNRFYPIYALAFAGLREGELLGLHIEDIDMQNHIINVRHAVQYLIGKGLVITEPKTDSSKRAVKLPDFIWVVLKKHLDSLKRNQGLIFTTSNGTPFSPRNLIRDFKECLSEAGLPEIRFHDLRHTTASLLLSQGVHPKVVQEMLGHSQISLTMDTYSHVLPGLQDDAAVKMNGILSGIKA